MILTTQLIFPFAFVIDIENLSEGEKLSSLDGDRDGVKQKAVERPWCHICRIMENSLTLKCAWQPLSKGAWGQTKAIRHHFHAFKVSVPEIGILNLFVYLGILWNT